MRNRQPSRLKRTLDLKHDNGFIGLEIRAEIGGDPGLKNRANAGAMT